MIAIVPVSPENVATFKDVRLRALEDAPTAFASTYAREAEFSDEEWMRRTLRWDGVTGIGYLAMEGDLSCGIAGAFLAGETLSRALLVSMWTSPTHRKSGVGRMLMEAIEQWSRERGARRVELLVTSTNEVATHFYKRMGFILTGRSEPHPFDDSVIDFEMVKTI